MTKSLDNNKKDRLANAAYKLFIKNGFKDTSIQEIVDCAGVAKGTFYLYFEDKYDIQEYLITLKSHELFTSALKNLDKKNIVDFYDRIINVVDFIIDRLNENKDLLTLISKDLSWGVFGDRVTSFIGDPSLELLDMFKNGIKEYNIKIDNPELTLFMIIELTSSTVFSSIIHNQPLPIEELKPHLYKTIKSILSN